MAERPIIKAEPRTVFGKGYARRLRKAGKIPAVIYGHGAEPVHIALPGHETMLAARNPNAVLSVDVDGTNHLTLIKDVQRHAIRPEIYHVDLLTVRRGERVEVEVPVVVEGEVAPGNISTQSESVLLLDVDALDVPEELLVDVTDRQDGEHVTAADVLLPALLQRSYARYSNFTVAAAVIDEVEILLDALAELHHQEPLAHMRHHREIVADEDVGQLPFAPEA